MSTTPKVLRTRNMTAAKRSLSLIEAAVAEHRKALDDGKVPENGFAVYVIKYETALAALRTLDALDGDVPVDDGTGEVRLDDLGPFVLLVHTLSGPGALQGDGPLARLAAVAFPDGLPGAGPEQEA